MVALRCGSGAVWPYILISNHEVLICWILVFVWRNCLKASGACVAYFWSNLCFHRSSGASPEFCEVLRKETAVASRWSLSLRFLQLTANLDWMSQFYKYDTENSSPQYSISETWLGEDFQFRKLSFLYLTEQHRVGSTFFLHTFFDIF